MKYIFRSDLLAVSHKEAYFTSDSGQESIVFEKTSPLDYSVNLYFQDESGSTVLNNYVSTHETENGVTFNVRFPRSGMFEISIYAKKKGDQGRYVCVYEYVAYVPVRMMNCCPFPKKYGSWTNGCTVEGLNDGEVCEDKNISVRAVIPKARQVVVRKSASDHVTYLTQVRNLRPPLQRMLVYYFIIVCLLNYNSVCLTNYFVNFEKL